MSELIERLQAILDAEGDLTVTCWPYDGQGQFYDLGEVEVMDSPEKRHRRTGEVIRLASRIVNLDA